MNPWETKPGQPQGSSLKRDKNLATGSRFTQQPSTSSGAGFRSQSSHQHSDAQPTVTFDQFQAHQRPQHHNSVFTDPVASRGAPIVDGADIQAFLNSTAYTDQIYNDDLHPGSTAYTSYRHQWDSEHSVAEHKRLHSLVGLLQADDIVEYLKGLQYTDDIYGVPPAIESLVKKAQQEATTSGTEPKVAVERLKMVRDHLMGRAHGDAVLAAQQAQTLPQEDWNKFFS